MTPVRIGVLGLGTVGGGTVNVLRRNGEEIARRAGRDVVVTRAAVRSVDRARICATDGIALTTDPGEIVRDPDVDVVVELIGGTNPARGLVLDAIARGKHVVTANKALVAMHGNAIFEAAHARGVMVAFEAAVAGGIPIIKALREGLAGNRIEWLAGIINGTSNFILTEMRDRGAAFAEVLDEAQRLGYAEADPTFDVEGGGRRAQARDTGRHRIRHAARLRTGAYRRHHRGDAGGRRLRRTARLPDQASRDRAAHRGRGGDAGAPDARARA